MNNNNISIEKCEEELLNFITLVTNGYNKVDTKFLADILSGIFKSNSVILADIARSAIHNCSIKKSIERLSRLLGFCDLDRAKNNYIRQVESILPPDPLYIIDDTDVVKPLAKKMEGLSLVRDGSDYGKYKKGYFVTDVVAIANNAQPVSIYSKLCSCAEKEFKSTNTLNREIIEKTTKSLGKGTFIADRAYDNVKFYRDLIKNGQDFIVRCKSNRNVRLGNKLLNIKEAAKTVKGKFAFKLKFQSSDKESRKASFIDVRLPAMGNKAFKLVVVYGFSLNENEPFMLLTNRKLRNKSNCIKVVRDYISRWKVEEYFKFKKQEYGLEKIRLSKLESLKSLNDLLAMVTGLIAIISSKSMARKIMRLAKPIKEKATFIYYRLVRGIRQLKHMFRVNIRKYLYPPKQARQYDFFHYLKYKKHYLNFSKNLQKSCFREF